MGERLREWLLLAVLAILFIVLPVWALNQTGWIRLAGQIILTLVLLLVLGATGLFGYICIRAKERKWGAGLWIIALLSILTIYWIWFGSLPLL
jgi:hypothetical protein